MKGSIKANLIVFLIIATIAFGVSLTFANLTIHDNHDSYKLISLDDDSFEPNYIYKVPTVKPKKKINTTNTTIETIIEYNTTTDDTNYTYTDNDTWEDTYDEYDEED